VRSPRAALTLATASFALSFAAWGLVSAFAPTFRQIYGLTATQTALLVAVPVLLGSVARLPIGMLTDRLGGRVVFPGLMLASAVAAWVAPTTTSFRGLLAAAFCLGLAGSSFACGVAFVSRWAPPEKQGGMLGIYGLGNAGQSAAVFGGPLVATLIGWQGAFRVLAVALVAWSAAFWLMARNAPGKPRPRGLADMTRVLVSGRLPSVLSLFYFLTFGGFVAFSIYLPTLLRDQFHLSAADAGFRTAGFVVLATGLRPLGGMLADRVGGARVLSVVFLGIAPFAVLLGWPSMVPFTVGALGCAALLGLGNGAVFKLVPQYFPAETGTVTGLVGAMGGLGGFFPPLVLGVFRDRLGSVWPGFVLLGATALLLWEVNRRVFLAADVAGELTLPPELRRTADRLRAGTWATLWTALLIAAIVVGSRNLQHFDAALVVYTFATIFAMWGVAYHYAVWLQKPPTRMYWRRGVELLRRHGIKGAMQVTRVGATHLAGQRFIYRRSPRRWWMHQLLFWGCLLAAAITFPLVFGWIHFESRPDDQMTYVTYLFGFATSSFRIRTAASWLLFHGLDVAAFLVLAGIGLSLSRRMFDRGAQAVQSFATDLLPLVMLFAISVTGLALTASATWLGGGFYGFLSILHAITVIAALLYLPFGKFFHIFQRPAQIGVKLYQRDGDAGAGALCARCGERYTSAMHLDDLKLILPELGFDYAGRSAGMPHWQDLCPACKRRTLASAQLRLKEEAARG
jgi:MFS transporter, NNP family, nitrate/nitrite transporter